MRTLVIIGLFIFSGSLVWCQGYKTMTFNIRYDNPDDGMNSWEKRKESVAELILYYEPSILGIQEGLIHQLAYLDKRLENYGRIGVGRDDGKEAGEFCAIYYDTLLFSLIKEGTFWLSPKSEEVSVGWDASMERICTYGIFEMRDSGKKWMVFNAHFDHVGQKAREMSAKLIIQKVKELNVDNLPVVLMGDFNAEPNSPPIQIFNAAFNNQSRVDSTIVYGPIGTFTGFKTGAVAERRIDYIFTQGLKIKKYRHIDDKRKDGFYISDHLPVMMELEIVRSK